MTTTEAKENIGQPFKLCFISTGFAGKFDVIRSVDENGIVYGDFIEAPAEDVRLKNSQPLQLKKEKQNDTISP